MPRRRPLPKPAPRSIEIDGQLYYVVAGARGEYVLPDYAPKHLAIHTQLPSDLTTGAVAEYEVDWVYGQRREKRRVRCALEDCDRSLQPGQRRFCSYKHAHRHAQRVYSRHRRGIERWVTLRNSAAYRFVRPFSKSLHTARRLFLEHIAPYGCQYRSDVDEVCPSVHNPNADPLLPRCLIYAVYADDLMLWTGRHHGVPVVRRHTTADGYWKERDGGSEGGSESGVGAPIRPPSIPLVEPQTG